MFKKIICNGLIFLSIVLPAANAKPQATTPLFVITPLLSAPSTTIAGNIVTVIYQVINNTGKNFPAASLVNLQPGIAMVNNGNPTYCNTNPFSLAAGATCLLKVSINTQYFQNNVTWNPKICTEGQRKMYCSQAYPSDQVAMTLLPPVSSTDCTANSANITFSLIQTWVNGTLTQGWGYSPISIPMNPAYTPCTTGAAGVTWMQNRVVDVASFWVRQKINYCHHYSSDYATPVNERCDSAVDGPTGANGGCCSLRPNLVKNSPTYGKIIRWNYSGRDSETAEYWTQFARLWYGVDCTNFTRLVYNMAFGTLMTGKTSAQAGQTPNVPANEIAPNQQTAGNQLNYFCAPGQLVCGDGTMDAGGNTFCAGHGGEFAANGVGNYFSLINASGVSQSRNETVTAMAKSQLDKLQPGDIVYIAGDLDTGEAGTAVTHGVIWTGKKVGYGPNDINPSLIAPDELCTPAVHCDWTGEANIGQWVIIDSHYQGADYRVFTNYFYLYDTWGVRRIAGSTWYPGYNCGPPD